MSTYLGQFTVFFVLFLWAPLPCSVLDYQPDFLLFLLFSHSITSILSSYSLPKGSHLFPGVEYLLDADDSPQFHPRLARFSGSTLAFSAASSLSLPAASPRSQTSQVQDGSLSLLCKLPDLYSSPRPPLSPSLPCVIVITVHSLFRSDT